MLVNAHDIAHRFFAGTLARMPVGGGAPREMQENVRDADWAPDGRSMAIVVVSGDSCRLEYPIGTRRYATTGYISAPCISADWRAAPPRGSPHETGSRAEYWLLIPSAPSVLVRVVWNPGFDAIRD